MVNLTDTGWNGAAFSQSTGFLVLFIYLVFLKFQILSESSAEGKTNYNYITIINRIALFQFHGNDH